MPASSIASQWRKDAGTTQQASVAYDRGYERTLDDYFERTGVVIGKGGFGLVTVVVERATGQQYALKTIKKRLNVPNIAPVKIEQHLSNIDREIKVLKLLRGTLSVALLKGVYEDEESVHIVMEYCKGGELYANISTHGALTETKVATYMRSVLQTLAQCHSHRILHRDVKPGNFLLLNEDENSPLKAVDFGLAVMWERDEQLPRTDLGLDGTPWFMAPEVISESETYPVSDVWSAGVMCYQLLSGKLPFDDASNRRQPSLSLVWRSILIEDVSFAGTEWAKVSGSAKKFVMRLLNKDPNERPTANEALRDPWLLCASQTRKDRMEPLDLTVVQRLQRFAQANLLQRTILELVASELIKTINREGWLPDETVRGVGGSSVGGLEGVGTPSTPVGAGVSGGVGGVGGLQSAGGLERRDSKGDELVFPMSPEAIGGLKTPGSVPGLRPFGHSSRSDQSLATHPVPISPINNNNLTSPERRRLTPASSFKRSSGQSYDWKAMRLASDLVLQGSGHRQSHYLHACSGLDDEERLEQRKAARLSLDPSIHGSNAITLQAPRVSPAPNSPFLPASGRSVGFVFPNDIDATDTASPVPSTSTTPGSNWEQSQEKSLEKGVRGRSLALEALQSTSSAGGSALVTNPIAVAPLMKKVGFRRGKVMSKSSLQRGLAHLGYSVEEDELVSLMSRVGLHDDSDGIQEAEFLATQLDWRELQRNNKQLWLECAKKAFEELDDSATGHINIEKVLGNLRTKLPDDEIDYAVEDALVDANLKDPEQVDFESFVKLITIGSHASLDGLDKFPDRVSARDLERRPSSATIHEAADEGQQDIFS